MSRGRVGPVPMWSGGGGVVFGAVVVVVLSTRRHPPVRARRWLAGVLRRLGAWVEPRTWAEADAAAALDDAWAYELGIVRAAAQAGSSLDAIRAVHDVTRHLDDKTIHEVLVLLAKDVAWSISKPGVVMDWADVREFHLVVDGLDDE